MCLAEASFFMLLKKRKASSTTFICRLLLTLLCLASIVLGLISCLVEGEIWKLSAHPTSARKKMTWIIIG
jgi:hypothetical protein